MVYWPRRGWLAGCAAVCRVVALLLVGLGTFPQWVGAVSASWCLLDRIVAMDHVQHTEMVRQAEAVSFILDCDPTEIEARVCQMVRDHASEVADLRREADELRETIAEHTDLVRSAVSSRRSTPIEAIPGADLTQPASSRYNRAARSAYNRGKSWDIGPVGYQKLSGEPCYYCQGPTGDGIGLDRIDNDLGYTIGNVLPACGRCNMLRGRILTIGETVLAVRAISDSPGVDNT